MDQRLAALLRLLELERLEVNIFRGESRDIGPPQVFGGQVLGQALRAAYATVADDRPAHSLHAYFLKRGDFNAPIVYFVDRSRDGHSFSSRRVTAIQHGEQIFHLSASFQHGEPGIEHQSLMPQVAPPESLAESGVLPQEEMRASDPVRRFDQARPFEFRPVPLNAPAPGQAPAQQIWIRTVDRVPADPVLHHCLLAYVSDYYLMPTVLEAHALDPARERLVMASIDHALWFHRPLRVDEWFLYATESPSASGARGFARGSLYARDGRLVASATQEGLVRILPAGPRPMRR